MDTDRARFERIPLSEWERLRDGLERFCEDGVTVDTDADGDRLTCRAGGASFVVTRAGDVEAGMPLHGFAASGVDAVGIDADRAELLVEAGDVRYVFRHP
jgi:hypothetical protein